MQQIINRSFIRSTKYVLFELAVGMNMRNKEDIRIKEMLNEDYLNHLFQELITVEMELKEIS